MSKSTFRPLHDRVVVKRIDAEEKTKGGIIIPDTAKEKPSQGEITAVGPPADPGFTVTVVEAPALVFPFETITWKISVVVAVTLGAVKVGLAVLVLESVAAPPLVWLQT